jgi:hypothetical protein
MIFRICLWYVTWRLLRYTPLDRLKVWWYGW